MELGVFGSFLKEKLSYDNSNSGKVFNSITGVQIIFCLIFTFEINVSYEKNLRKSDGFLWNEIEISFLFFGASNCRQESTKTRIWGYGVTLVGSNFSGSDSTIFEAFRLLSGLSPC